jgi:hypothetical protein
MIALSAISNQRPAAQQQQQRTLPNTGLSFHPMSCTPPMAQAQPT